jgi:hypothetical protein
MCKNVYVLPVLKLLPGGCGSATRVVDVATAIQISCVCYIITDQFT